MRIEISPLGSAHGQDNSILSTVIVPYADLTDIPIKELTNTSFRKSGVREAQPDIAFYIGGNLTFPPRNNAPINLDELNPSSLVVEIAASSPEDDGDRLQLIEKYLSREMMYCFAFNG
jgi:Uma2 family endonuclease